MTPRQQTRLNHMFARVKGETISTLEQIEEVVRQALPALRSGDVQLPADIYITMQRINAGMHKVLAGQHKVRGAREVCQMLRAEEKS